MPSDLQLFGFQLAVALGIFLGLNVLGRKAEVFGYETLSIFTEREEAVAFNFLFRAATPVVLLIIVAAVCHTVGLGGYTTNLHYAIGYYVLVRITFNVARGRTLLLPWGRLVFQWLVTAVLAVLAYDNLITKRDYLLPDLETVGNEVWLAIAAYLYVLADRVFSGDTSADKRGLRYLKSRRAIMVRNFGQKLEEKLPTARWRSLVVAVLVVEDFNRPRLARAVERLAFRFGKARTLGIMQVATDRAISDDESVALGIDQLMGCFSAALRDSGWRCDLWPGSDALQRHRHEEARLIHETLVRFNPSGDYARDVRATFERLVADDPAAARQSLHPEPIPQEPGLSSAGGDRSPQPVDRM